MKTVMYYLLIVAFLTGCTHGALKVADGPNNHPWIVAHDGSIHGYNGTGWDQIEAPGTADDLEVCGSFLVILTRPDADGIRYVKSRHTYDSILPYTLPYTAPYTGYTGHPYFI